MDGRSGGVPSEVLGGMAAEVAMRLGVQLAPSSRPNVVFGSDAARPQRFVVRRRFLRPSAALALVALYFAAWEQAHALDSEAYGLFLALTVVVWGAIAVALVRHRLVLDKRLGELRDELGLLFPFASRSRPLDGVRRVVVSLETRTVGKESQETVYPVDLDTTTARVRVDSVGLWESAVPLAEALARFLGLPVRDERRGGELQPDELDRPLREREPAVRPARQPREPKARVSADRPALLRVEILRPAVPQTLFLLGLVAAFCLIPLSIEGFRGERLSVAFYLLPVLVVASGAARHIASNGGTLSVTPEALRFARHSLFWRNETVIAAEELEDLTLVEPEIGGARSLLAYFSNGVLVARSDRASFRFGYGLPRAELEWLRRRIREVLQQGPRWGPALAGAECEPKQGAIPVFPHWTRVWVFTLAGGLAGRLVGGPFGVCAALPFLEEVLNTGALLGSLVGVALTPSLVASGAWRLPAALLGAALATGVFLSKGDLVQGAPSLDEGWTFGGRPAGAAVDEPRLRAGFCVASVVIQAMALNALLLAIVRLAGGAWRPRVKSVGAELAADLRGFEGVAPPGALLALAVVGVAAAALTAQVTLRDNAAHVADAPLVSLPRPGAEAPAAGSRAAEPPPAGSTPAEWGPGAGARLEGRLLFAGRPLHERTRAAVRFWFRDERSGREARLLVEHGPSSSAFRVAGPPGTYLASVSAGPRHDFPPHVSYSGSRTFSMTGGEPQALDLSLERIIRLRQPVDNARTLPPSSSEEPVHDSPVRFAWDPLPEASSYRVDLQSPDRAAVVAKGEQETSRPEIELELPPGRYELALSAHGPSGLVGRLEVYGQDYRAWRYRFSVR